MFILLKQTNYEFFWIIGAFKMTQFTKLQLRKSFLKSSYYVEVVPLFWENIDVIFFTCSDGGYCAGLKINLHEKFEWAVIMF